jgi:hypothetical protein
MKSFGFMQEGDVYHNIILSNATFLAPNDDYLSKLPSYHIINLVNRIEITIEIQLKITWFSNVLTVASLREIER